jgi:5'-nucleotidase/UDP-sugar diphosphatase
MSEIRIVHTSDFHDRLTPQKAARLRALKEAHDALLIDTGDAIRAPNVAVMPWRERAVSLMNEAGYDAMGLGNREYFFRAGGMAWKTGHATFPRICCNLQAKRGEPEGVEPWKALKTPQGGRVGLFALMPTMIEPGHWFERLSDTRFREWQEAAAAAASGLAGKADISVALFHRPEAEIDELVTLCPEMGLILLGHTHGTPGVLERRADGVVVSRVGERARHARLIGLRTDDRSVTMDELVDLDSPAAAETGR